jgi:hypothetical protein
VGLDRKAFRDQGVDPFLKMARARSEREDPRHLQFSGRTAAVGAVNCRFAFYSIGQLPTFEYSDLGGESGRFAQQTDLFIVIEEAERRALLPA